LADYFYGKGLLRNKEEAFEKGNKNKFIPENCCELQIKMLPGPLCQDSFRH
jgi:hypothetical protein